MRGTVAKRIRRQAREKAANDPTTYNTTWWHRLVGKADKKTGQAITDVRGTVTCTGFRRAYQDMKRAYSHA